MAASVNGDVPSMHGCSFEVRFLVGDNHGSGRTGRRAPRKGCGDARDVGDSAREIAEGIELFALSVGRAAEHQ